MKKFTLKTGAQSCKPSFQAIRHMRPSSETQRRLDDIRRWAETRREPDRIWMLAVGLLIFIAGFVFAAGWTEGK